MPMSLVLHILVEILYEYLSQHISTLFEKTVEGVETLHDSLICRQKEHERIVDALNRIEQRLESIEKIK